jgi:serine/threonine-protein kinase
MATRIALNVITGTLKGKEFAFTERTRCQIGRSPDCLIQLPDDWEYRDISRHHCELEIDPPLIRVRDLGSLNGTFVNGEKIGQRNQPCKLRSDEHTECMCHELHEGDELKVGHVVLRVSCPPEDISEQRSEAASLAGSMA